VEVLRQRLQRVVLAGENKGEGLKII